MNRRHLIGVLVRGLGALVPAAPAQAAIDIEAFTTTSARTRRPAAIPT